MAFRLRSRRSIPEQRQPSAPDNPAVFERTKRLGIFAVEYLTPHHEYAPHKSVTQMYKDAGVINSAQERILDLHLRQDIALENAGPEAVRRSFGLLAQYVRQQTEHMQPDEIVGVTDPALGRVATRFGFEMHDMNAGGLPPQLRDKIDQLTGREGARIEDLSTADFRPGHDLWWQAPRKLVHDVGHLVVVHQTTEQFLDSFGDDVEHEENALPV